MADLPKTDKPDPLAHWGTPEEQMKKLKLAEKYWQKLVSYQVDGEQRFGIVETASIERGIAVIIPLQVIDATNKIVRRDPNLVSTTFDLLEIETHVELFEDQFFLEAFGKITEI